mgnify:FL=1
MKNKYDNIKKIIEVFFKIDKISFANDNLNYLFDVALQIDKKVPKENYKKHFEEFRLRNIYSELEPLTIFFTFLKTTLKANTLEDVEKIIPTKLSDIITLISKDKIKLYDFKNLSTKEMIEFTNDFHKIFGLVFKGYKHHVKRFSEYEMIHDSKDVQI